MAIQNTHSEVSLPQDKARGNYLQCYEVLLISSEELSYGK
jgi:hypothetical protein